MQPWPPWALQPSAVISSAESWVKSRPRAGDHRNPDLGLVDAPFGHLLVLVMRQSRAFAGGPDRHQAVGPFGDLPLGKVAEHLLVDRAVFEGRDQRGERSPEIRLGGHRALP